MNLVRSLGSVGGLTLVSRILALVRDTLQASFVGAGFASDAFFVSFRLPNMFRALFAEGAFSAAFIPMFNRKVGGRRRAAGRPATSPSGRWRCCCRCCSLFTLVMIAAAWPVTWGLSGGFKDPTPAQFAFAVEPVADHHPLSDADQPRLPARRHPQFARPLLGQRRGADPAQPRDDRRACGSSTATDAYETARAQAISVTVGGVLQLAWLMLACRQAGVSLKLRRPRLDDDVRRLLKLILPAAIGAGAVQVNLAISTALAGGLLDPGSISYIYYADRLNQLPLGPDRHRPRHDPAAHRVAPA